MEKRTATKVIIKAALLAAVLAVTGTAEQYVSLKGNFYITYPDDWAQVDYRLVNAYLLRNRAERPIFDFDAVLAQKNAPHFFSAEYLILTVDSVGELDAFQIDSVLYELSSSFGKKIKYIPTADFLAELTPNTPNYDKKTKTATILNESSDLAAALKKNLLMMKFYEKGIATFYFYSPDSLFEAKKPLFEQIIASFSTENIDSVLPKEQLEVADLKDVKGVMQKESDDGNTGGISKTTYLYIGVALVLILVVVIRRLK